tara:strand:+ start:2114 stop:2551 length:438 start_codon:yes stop_codon:yes gene_type:complete
MTTSIVFSEKCSDTNVEDISFLSTTDPNYVWEWLSDPTASRDSLQGLRYLKTRETGDQIVTPDISGRDQGQSVDFDSYTYDQLAARRKEEVLKYSNTSSSPNKKTKKGSYAYASTHGSISSSRLKKLKESQTCKTTSSVPFFSSL